MPQPVRYFFDTEFLEDSHDAIARVQLISIGMICEDGRSIYLENADFDWTQPMDPWLVENVKVHLAGPGSESWATPAQMAVRLREFVGEDPEFWAYVAAYDWIGLLSIFGRLIDRPKGWPNRCRDLKDSIESAGLAKSELPLQDQTTSHDALADARWNLEVSRFLASRA